MTPTDAQIPEPRRARTKVVHYRLTDRAPTWQVAPKPTLILEGTPDAPFSQIAGAVRLDDGGIVVAEWDTHQLHFFDAKGSHRLSTGRSGKGPGDFNWISEVERRGGVLIVYDGNIAVHFVRTSDGRHLETRHLPRLSGYTTNPAIGVIESRTILFRARPIRARPPVGIVTEDSIPVFMLPPGAPPTRLRLFPVARTVRPAERSASYLIGFGPRGRFAVFPERYCAGYTADYEITCFDVRGEPVVIVTRETLGREVTPRERATLQRNMAGFREDGSNRYEGSLREHRAKLAAILRFAATHPAFFDLFAAQTGDLWVREYAPEDGASDLRRVAPVQPSTWSVFAPDGEWVGRVELPTRFVPTDIGADYVLGVIQDEDEVERVALFRLRSSR
jgi:hypothetical protein